MWSLEPENQYVRRLHELALVGRHWFSHVRAATELWTTLRTDQSIDEVHLVLRKSKERSLRIIVAGSTSFDTLCAAKAGKMRWESFELFGPPRKVGWVHSTFSDTPRLREASFHITAEYGDEQWVNLPPFLYKCNLRHVRLVGMTFDWTALLGAGLITLDVDNTESIPAPEELCKLLAKCPQLQQLRLWGRKKLALPGTSSDVPRSRTDHLIHMPSLTSLKLRYLSPQHLLLLVCIDAPNCAMVVFGNENVVLEEAVAQKMPPLLATALTAIFRSCNLIAIEATKRRGLCISLHRPGVQSPDLLEIQTSRPVEILNVVGGVLTSRRIRTPVTLYCEEQVPLTQKTMRKFPTLRQIKVVGGAMCEDLMRGLAHAEVGVDGKRMMLCPNLEYVRMIYGWGESVPSSHCPLLLDAARRRWTAENGDDPWDRPFWPDEFAIFPPREVSTEFREAVEEAQRIVPAIRLVEDDELFSMTPVTDSDTDM